MSKIKYDIALMQYMSLFEGITKSKIKDCISTEDFLIFIVNENEAAKAIGKKGVNVKRLQEMFKKKIKIVEFSNDKLKFIKNFIAPLKAQEIKEENNIVFIKGDDNKTRGLLIGRNAKNLEGLKNIVKRHFEFEDIRVV